MESSTFIKLTQQQGLNTNLEAGGGQRRGTSSGASAGCSHTRGLAVHVAVGHSESDVWPPVCLLALGLRQSMGAAHPLSVSDVFASPRKFHPPSAGSERAPGYGFQINEAANYIHLL